MHPNPLLEPLFWDHVVARQLQLLCAALRCRAERRGDLACVGTDQLTVSVS